MKNKIIDFNEQRNYSMNDVEIRAATDEGASNTIVGYAVKYNQQSEVMRDYWGDEFVEEFAVGAFDESLTTRSQKCLWNHDTNIVLGSVKSNTLDIRSDDIGLRVENILPNNNWGNDARESINRKDVDGMSFLFRASEDKWSTVNIDGADIYKRTVMKAELFEVSPTTFPAYPSTEVNMRSFEERQKDVVVNKNSELDESELRKRKLLLLLEV